MSRSRQSRLTTHWIFLLASTFLLDLVFSCPMSARIVQLSDLKIYDIFYDKHSGIVWVGTSDGLHYTINGTSLLPLEATSKNFTEVYSITTAKGKVIFGTDSGVFFVNHGAHQEWPSRPTDKTVLSIRFDGKFVFFNTEFYTGSGRNRRPRQQVLVENIADNSVRQVDACDESERGRNLILLKERLSGLATPADGLILFTSNQATYRLNKNKWCLEKIDQGGQQFGRAQEILTDKAVDKSVHRYLLSSSQRGQYPDSSQTGSGFDIYSYESHKLLESGILAAAIVEHRLWISKNKQVLTDSPSGFLPIDGIPSKDFTRIINTGNYIWIISERGIIYRESESLKTQTLKRSGTLIESATETDAGVFMWGIDGAYVFVEDLEIDINLNNIQLIRNLRLSFTNQLKVTAEHDSGEWGDALFIREDQPGFEFILEKKENRYETRLESGLYFDTEDEQLELTGWITRAFVAARDSFGNEWPVGDFWILNARNLGFVGTIITVLLLLFLGIVATCLILFLISLTVTCLGVIARHLSALRTTSPPESHWRRLGRWVTGLIFHLLEFIRIFLLLCGLLLYSIYTLFRPLLLRRWLLLSWPMKNLQKTVFNDKYRKTIDPKTREIFDSLKKESVNFLKGLKRSNVNYIRKEDVGSEIVVNLRDLYPEDQALSFMRCVAFHAAGARQTVHPKSLPVFVQLEDLSYDDRHLIPSAVITFFHRIWPLDENLYGDTVYRHSIIFFVVVACEDDNMIRHIEYLFNNLTSHSKYDNYLVIYRKKIEPLP